MVDVLVTVIFAACLAPGASDYDYDCVDYMNNCAVEKNGEVSEKSIEKCLKDWKTRQVAR